MLQTEMREPERERVKVGKGGGGRGRGEVMGGLVFDFELSKFEML